MNKTLQILLISVLLFTINSSYLFSQKPPGYIGSLNLIGINFSGSTRLISGMLDNGYLKKELDPNSYKKEIITRPHVLRGGINAEYIRIVGRNIGFGLKYQYSRVTISSYNELNTFTHEPPGSLSNTYYINITSPVFKSVTIKPTIVYNSKPSFLPIGLRHTISFGPRFVSFNLNKDYYHRILSDQYGTPYENQSPELIEKPKEGFSNKLKGVDIAYNGSITYPINNFLIFEVGYEFRAALMYENSEEVNSNRKYFENNNSVDSSLSEAFYNRNYSDMVKSEILGRIFSMNMGLIFAF